MLFAYADYLKKTLDMFAYQHLLKGTQAKDLNTIHCTIPIPKKLGYTYRLTGIGLGVSVHGTPCVLKPDKQQKMMVDGFKFTFLFYLQLQLKKASYSIVQYRYSIHYED